MASNQTPSIDSTENINNPIPSKEHPKKTIVAYRPASKAKKSASRPQNVANKTNKSPEDLQEEVMQLKKTLASISDENSTLKAKIRRTEEENVKKDKQILQYLDPSQNEELRRLMMDKKSAANTTINNLKQRVIKLELSLKEKEQTLKKLQGDLKATKAKEMKIQLDTCYQEIVRLKSLNQKRSCSGSSKAQKEFAEDGESEEKTHLGCGSNGPSAVERVYSARADYANMTKDQLLAVVWEMEKKQKRQRTDIMADTKSYHEKKKLEEKLKQVSEERRSYQKLAENRDTEVKSLRSTIATLQKSSEKDLGVRQSTSSRAHQNASEMEKLGSVARGTSAPTRSNKQLTPVVAQDSFTMSSTVRKMSSRGTEVRKTGSSFVSPRVRAEDKAESAHLAGNRSLNKLELDLSKITYDNRRTLSARCSVRASNRSSTSTSTSTVTSGPSVQPTDSEQWVMQATVRKMPEKPFKLNRKSPTRPRTSSPPSKSPAVFTVLKSPEKVTLNGAESKFQAAGDSHRVVDFHVIQEFQQNRAARKIQKGWKKHQGRQKLAAIRNNRAARTIQLGWKKHRVLKNQEMDLTDTRSVNQEMNLSDARSLNQEMNLSDTGPVDHDDDDDVVC